MLIENRWYIIFGGGFAAYLFSFTLGIGHSALHSCPYDGQFQFGKYRAHLDERLAHRVNFTVAAIYGDAPEDFKTQVFGLDNVHDFT